MTEPTHQLSKPLKDLRTTGMWEGVSYLLLLFVAMPLKYYAGVAVAVKIMGSVHGILFILFMYSIYNAMRRAGLSFGRAVIAFIASLVPFGTFFLDKLIFQSNTTK